MGGRSDGRFKINKDKKMEFFGTLSLENNGGFASVPFERSNLGLQNRDSIVVRVRGDGREYSLNLYTPSRRMAFSYRTKFKTRKDKSIDVRIPLDKFVATSFGRVIRSQVLDPGAVNGLGILLGDKKPGPFELEVDWIKVIRDELVVNLSWPTDIVTRIFGGWSDLQCVSHSLPRRVLLRLRSRYGRRRRNINPRVKPRVA